MRSWGYRCVLTNPMIELMSADLPHTLYRKKGAARQEDIDESTRLMIEAAERRKKLREAEQYSINEVFEGKADLDAQEDGNE